VFSESSFQFDFHRLGVVCGSSPSGSFVGLWFSPIDFWLSSPRKGWPPIKFPFLGILPSFSHSPFFLHSSITIKDSPQKGGSLLGAPAGAYPLTG